MAQVLAIDPALSLKQFESPARDGVIQVFHSFKASFDLGGLYGWAGRRRLRCSCGFFRHWGDSFRSLFLVFQGVFIDTRSDNGQVKFPLIVWNNTVRLQMHVIFVTVQ
jgi:hypothetical protein